MSKNNSQELKPYAYTDSFFKNLPIEARCVLDAITEACKIAELEGHNRIVVTPDQVNAKIAKRRREQKEKEASYQRFLAELDVSQ